MDLIKRYIYAVGRWIPGKQKKDILKELESAIYDALEARFGKRDDYGEDQIEEVLKEMGPPWKVASGYTKLGDKLIGPGLLPLYFMLAAIISAATAFGLLVGFVIGLFTPDTTLASFFLDFPGFIASVLFSTVFIIGMLTVIFALIERFTGDELPESLRGEDLADGVIAGKTWSPSKLPTVPEDKQKISIREPVVAILFTIAALILFNFFSDIIGIYYISGKDGETVFVPIFSDAFKAYLPLWNISLAFSLLFNIYMIVKMRWNLTLRIGNIVGSLINMAILAFMVKGPELVDMKGLLAKADTSVFEALSPLAEAVNYSIDFILIFALVATCIGLIIKVVKLFNPANYLPDHE